MRSFLRAAIVPGALLAAHRHKAPPQLTEIDPSTPPQIEALVQATPVGPLSLKGFHQPVPAFALTDLVAPS